MNIEDLQYNDLRDMVFSKKDLYDAMQRAGYFTNENTFLVYFQSLIKRSLVQRIGRNKYCIADTSKSIYKYMHSSLACEVIDFIQDIFPNLDFTVFETMQLNEFFNCWIGPNTLFVFVDPGSINYVFESVQAKFSGMVLKRPSAEMFNLYGTEDSIILCKLISEAPIRKETPHESCAEKWLVDIVADPLLRTFFIEEEYAAIYENMFDKYVIDQSKLFRYAKRRNAYEKIIKLIKEQTNIILIEKK